MPKRHNILPTRTIFFISSAGRTESVQRGGSRTAADPPLVQEFKIKLFEQLFYLR